MISKHISEKEATKSITALRLGLDNTPDGNILSNMKLLADNIFEPLREYVGGPIKINSMYRSEALNKAIGGSSKSQHCDGKAFDIDDIYGHKTNAEMFNYIKDNLNLVMTYTTLKEDIKINAIEIEIAKKMPPTQSHELIDEKLLNLEDMLDKYDKRLDKIEDKIYKR